MPKKQPRNSFYFFMIDFKEDQRKKGIVYANMAEVSQAAGPLWPSAAPALRAKYEAMAKAEKAKANVPERKFTSTGVSLAELEAAERERNEAIEAERRDIINFVKQKSVNENILDEDIFLMDVNSYCKAGGAWLVGELTLLRFTLRHGVKDTYHEQVNPGGIPIGYALDVKLGSRELGLPMPEEGARRADYIQILANAVDYLRRHDGAAPAPAPPARPARPARPAPLPPLYTLPDKVPQCLDFIQQLCSRAAEDEALFRVYRLDALFFQLVAAVPARADEGFPKESLALARLKQDPFKYSPGLACEMHEKADKAVECSSGRVKRWAFTVLDTTCSLLGLRAQPARHVPADYHLDSILTYKEEKRAQLPAAGARGAGGAGGAGRGAAHVAPDDTPSSVDSSYCSSLDTSRNTTADKKRTHVPLRMPKTDYSMCVRAAPSLSASHEDFPPLGARGGKGRGRGLAANFDQLKINNAPDDGPQ